MKTVGIVSEFNPFHNGHKYLIDTVREKLQADCVVSVMSGNYTQRGEPAVFDMYSRAEIACKNGVDLVLELPPQFVLTSAQYYAYYSVYLLHQLGSIDYLCFGSECGDLSVLQSAILQNVSALKNQMKTGVTYAKAVSDSDLLNQPNNILAVEYLRALKKLHSPILPYTIKRISVDHNSKETSGQFASASLLRKKIKKGEDISFFVPEVPNTDPIFEDSLIPCLKYRLLCATQEDISGINNISEGLENRFLKYRDQASLQNIIDAVKCKRYPETRIRRALYSLLLNIPKSEDLPGYTRVLAFTKTGQDFLKATKESSALTIYSRLTKKDIAKNPQLRKELYCNELYTLAKDLSR
ncbi:MAG: nucleotidyltransferase family protein [Clostridia bacterium]|nr:nucleotidyltransferase family protein [Clostridia bacterium]